MTVSWFLYESRTNWEYPGRYVVDKQEARIAQWWKPSTPTNKDKINVLAE